jgi:hypothetical protein
MTFTLVPSDWSPLTQDTAEGVTTFFDDMTSGSDAYPNESGEMTIFDNTVDKVAFQLDSFNTSTVEMDQAVANLIEYAIDAYSIDMNYTWLASEVTASDSVGWCLEAETFGLSCWLLTKDGNGDYTSDAVSYWIATADFDATSDTAWDASDIVTDTANGTTGFNGTWYCDTVTFPSDTTESVNCARYQPQAADSYTSDYRFAPQSEGLNPSPPVYNVHSYFSSRGTGVKYTSEEVTLLGAT